MEENVSEQIARTLKKNIYKYITAISKNVYIDNSDDMVDNTNIHIREQWR